MRSYLALLCITAACSRAPATAATAPAPVSSAAIMPAAPGPSANPIYARLPAAVGGFRLTERNVVRDAPTDSLFRYSDGSPTRLTVIVYEAPEDVRLDSDPQKWTAREGEKFRKVLDILQREGRLAAYTVAFSDTTRFDAGGTQILEHKIAAPTRLPNGVIYVDFQYLYLIEGKFLKVRATVPRADWERTTVPSFARELAKRAAGS